MVVCQKIKFAGGSCGAGLGVKSTACIKLLYLQQRDFPVDVNVGRIAVRLGWVPLDKHSRIEVAPPSNTSGTVPLEKGQ